MYRKAAGVGAIALLGVFGLYINIRLWFDAGHNGVDFNQFYAAAKLAGTGRLYDWNSLRAIEARNGPAIPTARLPVVAGGAKLLTLIPYPDALLIWRVASIAAALGVCFIWPCAKRWLLLLAFSWSPCPTYIVALGQDTVFWLMLFGLGLACLDRRPRLAGVVFALCICKYHLAIALPVLLIAQKRWKTLRAGVATVGALLAASFVIEGADWPRAYMRMLRLPELSPGVPYMANLNALVCWLPGVQWLELAAGSVCFIVLLWLVSKRAAPPGFAGAATAACGFVLGLHGYVGDCALLAPLAVLVLQSSLFPLFLRCWAVFIVTPVLMFAVVSQTPYVGQIGVVGFVLISMGVVIMRGREEGAGQPKIKLQAIGVGSIV
jgi:Glycosyltransferase family 87